MLHRKVGRRGTVARQPSRCLFCVNAFAENPRLRSALILHEASTAGGVSHTPPKSPQYPEDPVIERTGGTGGKQFFILFPLMKMNEDRSNGDETERGFAALHDRNFSEKESNTWPAHGGERASSGHENAAFYGFIMRMV